MRKGERFIWGICLVAMAVAIIANQFDVISFAIGGRRIIAAIIALAILIRSIADREIGGVIVAIGIGYFAFYSLLGLPEFPIWALCMVVVLLSMGLKFMFPKTFDNKSHNRNHNYDDYEDASKVGERQQVTDVEENGNVTVSNTFGALAKYVSTKDLKSAEITNRFGELKVYFDNATIITSPVNINVSDTFGAVKLFIPRDWNINVNISTAVGNAIVPHNLGAADGPVVNISGSATFGEVEIILI